MAKNTQDKVMLLILCMYCSTHALMICVIEDFNLCVHKQTIQSTSQATHVYVSIYR